MSKDFFGFDWIVDLNARRKLKNNFNIYVSFTFDYLHNSKRVTTDLFILDKSLDLDENLTLLKTRYVFPNRLIYLELFTDNRTVIPKEFQVKEVEPKKKDNQLTFNF